MIEKVKSFFGVDGLLHIVCSALIVGVAGVFMPLWAAVLVAALVGVGKEVVYDRMLGKGTFDRKDLLADAVGIIIGAL